ncbi:hypothetical protein Pst134EA_032743 [Puccinia striiformis f. sp. tritici]|uniref:uncharacterized protein n=1 Tax=Puccinia striiformis f. sp. tritici TaxID=168172 RepID=UPI00200756A5|nr:uncharacterized protein Pst134EA_032743 [Puccinia striiformis f. sp. tritici]KAH9441641.1 hypothetical protein Pst134EA_032743 [Puccinia striiformis f. sp. tritici]
MAPLRSPKQPLAIRGGFGKTLKRPRTPTIVQSEGRMTPSTNQEAQARALICFARTCPHPAKKFEPGPSNILHGSRDNVKIVHQTSGQADVPMIGVDVISPSTPATSLRFPNGQPGRKKSSSVGAPSTHWVTNAAEAVPERDPTSKTGETSKEADGWAWSLTGTGLSQAIGQNKAAIRVP